MNQSSQDIQNKCKLYKNVYNNNQVVLYDNNKNNDNNIFECKDINVQINSFIAQNYVLFIII